ncbi:protein prickle-like [Homalodisca vitripennis]|uniref:protein prickle-like n=1 Tax=Homalodisca vitripennis TaxID=197043 RepID=UPI001EEBE157|nr:protein prickle-like [Homalodisca vitripennis]
MSRTTPARVYTRPSQAKWWKVCWMYGDRQLYGRTNAISQIGLDTGRNQNKSQIEVPIESGQFTPSPKPNLLRREPPQDLLNCHEDDGGFIALQYSWVPPGLTDDEIRQYFSALPPAKIPFVDSLGERYRVHQLLRQMPPQDNEARFTRHHQLSEEERSELRLITLRVKESSGRGKAVRLKTTSQCQSCDERLSTGDMSVFASRVGPNSCWHPACFVCSVCQELLVDLIYFYREGKLYCGRHHAETLKPRCPACDELILTDEQVKAEGCTWHMKHFACLECDQQLGGQRYMMRDGRPYCFTCFHAMFAEYCDSCGEPIGIDQGKCLSI